GCWMALEEFRSLAVGEGDTQRLLQELAGLEAVAADVTFGVHGGLPLGRDEDFNHARHRDPQKGLPGAMTGRLLRKGPSAGGQPRGGREAIHWPRTAQTAPHSPLPKARLPRGSNECRCPPPGT